METEIETTCSQRLSKTRYAAQDALQVDPNILNQVCTPNNSHLTILQARERQFYKLNREEEKLLEAFLSHTLTEMAVLLADNER